MFDHRHYVPILKAKQAELWAIARLKSKSAAMLTPLFELPPRKPKKGKLPKLLADRLAKDCKDIQKSWGESQPFFLDAKWLYARDGHEACIIAFEIARSLGLAAIPVLHLDDKPLMVNAVLRVCSIDRRGMMLRVPKKAIPHPEKIAALLSEIDLPVGNIDLLIDYQAVAMSLEADLEAVPELNWWRSVSCASGTFPSSLASYPQGDWHDLPRHCWESWRTAATGGGLVRIPTFSDYAIRDPGAPADFGRAPVALRYTATGKWIARHDGKVAEGEAGLIHDICADLIQRPEYPNPQFSAGDRKISECASHAITSGGATQWIQWGISHHLEKVVKEIASLSLP